MPRRRSRPEDGLPLSPYAFEVLLTLSQGERHGYDIVREVRSRTAGAVDLGTSTLYAAIRRLLEAGWVEEAGERPREKSEGPPRRYYRITPLGRQVARLEAERLQEVARSARSRFLEPRRARRAPR